MDMDKGLVVAQKRETLSNKALDECEHEVLRTETAQSCSTNTELVEITATQHTISIASMDVQSLR